MANYSLKDSSEYYLTLSEQPKRFDGDSRVTNVFFDDTNGEVFTVRSGGVTGVTVTGMDETKCTSFRMEDRGPIISIKFSPDHSILAIQRNQENQNATVEFVNFKDSAPTNVEYAHSCKWKNAKLLGFVWPKVNEIAFITDQGIELLQVLPDKKLLKSLKSTSFSGAWYTWCARSCIILLAGNNGTLLQPFALNNSTVTKLQKLELEAGRPVLERDVAMVRTRNLTICAIFRHANAANTNSPGPTEVWLLPITSSSGSSVQYTHILKTGLVGRFAVNVVDDLIVVHHQSSQTSLLFDIQEQSKPENNTIIHIPVVQGSTMKPAFVEDQFCPMYSVNWVMFQPDYIVDARLGCLWKVHLIPSGLAHSVPKDEIPKIVAVLLRRKEGKPTIYGMLNQLVTNAGEYLVELTKVFDEINNVYRQWADCEIARNTAGRVECRTQSLQYVNDIVICQDDMCHLVLQEHADDTYIVQVVTAYIASLSRHKLTVQHPVAELTVRTFVTRGAIGRLRSFVRRGCLGDARTLACQLWSLGNIERAATQLGLDMMWRLRAYNEVIVYINWEEPVTAIGVAKQAGPKVWNSIPPRRFLDPARRLADKGQVAAFVAVYNALRERNDKLRGSPAFLKGEQCDKHDEYYKQVTSD